MSDTQKDKKRDDVLKRMLNTPPDPRKQNKENSAPQKEGKTES